MQVEKALACVQIQHANNQAEVVSCSMESVSMPVIDMPGSAAGEASVTPGAGCPTRASMYVKRMRSTEKIGVY